jgi:N-acetylmuramoyl-L-alanine amidase
MATHVVAQGEHISSIAAQYGFSNYKTLWDDPNNADLKKLRENPNVLLPGDQVFIPDRATRTESIPADARSSFVLEVKPLKLRVKLLDLSDDPIDRIGKATTRAGPQDVSPQGHIYEADIDTLDTDVTLDFTSDPPLSVHLAVGSLDPVKEQTGQRERLNNLAYFAGFSQQIDPQQFQWAVEEFQCDHKKTDGLKVDGNIDESTSNGSKTQKALEKEHGV